MESLSHRCILLSVALSLAAMGPLSLARPTLRASATSARAGGHGVQQVVHTPQAVKQQDSWGSHAVAFIATACILGFSDAAEAAGKNRPPPITETENRCSLQTLDIFAETRAVFSQEASSGAMTEAIVDVRECNFSNQDLSSKVWSGVLLQNADLSGSKLQGVQMARADARGANLTGADFTDVNAYNTLFDGADLTDAQFENAILSNASFGQYKGKWAILKGAKFEGALLSSSDVGRICENPTLDLSTRKYELGCRGSR